jgi:hypothetical protein
VRGDQRRAGYSNQEFRQLRSKYLKEAYKLYVALLCGFGVLIAIQIITRGTLRQVLLDVFLVWPLVFFALVVRFWLTTTRQYLGERRRRGLKIYGRFGRFQEFFAEEDRSHPVTQAELERRKAGRRRK